MKTFVGATIVAVLAENEFVNAGKLARCVMEAHDTFDFEPAIGEYDTPPYG